MDVTGFYAKYDKLHSAIFESKIQKIPFSFYYSKVARGREIFFCFHNTLKFVRQKQWLIRKRTK